jgi:hypothetical protein
MFDRLTQLFKKSPLGDADQQQREALVDLLVLAMFIDRHVANAEGELIRARAEGGPDVAWQGSRSYQQFFDASVRRTRDVLGSDDATRAYLEDIALRLETDEQRDKALAACRELVDIDGERAEAEENLLSQAREIFAAAV